MAVVAAQLQVNIGGNSAGAEAAMARVGSQVNESTQRFGALRNAISFAFGQVIFQVFAMAMQQVVQQVKSLVDDTAQLQNAMTQTKTVLASTSDASGMTAKSIRDLAVSLSGVTPFSDLAIQSTENLLLTFRTIGKEVFPEATQAILDTAQAMHEDLKSATVQIGKALDDPIRGMTALTRIGVTFDAQQREQIKAMEKSGNLMGAQKMILQELEKEFGNSAKAAGTTFAGSMAILSNRFTLMKEQLGTALLPQVAKLAVAFSPVVGALAGALPSALAKVGQFFAAFGQAVKPVLALFEAQAKNNLTMFGNLLSGVVFPAAKLVAGIIQDDLGPALLALGNWMEQNVAPILVQVSDQIKQTMIPAFQNIQHIFEQNQPAIRKLGEELKSVLPAVKILALVVGGALVLAIKVVAVTIQGAAFAIVGLINVLNGIATIVGNVVSWFQNLGSNSKQSVNDMVTNIVSLITSLPQKIPFLIGEMVGLSIRAVEFMWTQFPKLIAQLITNVMGKIGQFVQDLPKNIASLAIRAVQLFDQLRSQALQKIVDLTIGIENELRQLPAQLVILAHQFMQGLVNGINDGVSWVVNAIKNVAGNMLNGIKAGLGIHSPSAVMHDMGGQTVQGFINGLLSQSPAQAWQKHIAQLTQPIKAGMLSLGAPSLGAMGSPALAGIPIPLATQQALITMQSAASTAQQSQQPIIITLDGQRVGKGLMPHIVTNIKQATGAKVQVR